MRPAPTIGTRTDHVHAFVLSLLYAFVFLTSLFLLAGCGNVRGKVEDGIAKSLPELIGPAECYRVRVSGSTVGMLKHKLSRIEIQGAGVRLSNGMELAKLNVVLTGVRFDPDKRSITQCAGTEYEATLSQAQLEHYLRKLYPDIPGLSVALEEGYAVATAAPSLMGVTASISAESSLKITGGTKLVLDIRKATMAGVPAPGFAREYIEKKINPVFDSSAFGYDATMSSVTIRPSLVVITGTLDLTKGKTRMQNDK